MSIFDDDIYDDGRASYEELLASGEYKTGKADILRGFKVFQRKYAYRSVAVQLTLVVLAISTQLVNVIMPGEGKDISFSLLLIGICVLLGIYMLMRPRSTYKNLEKSIDEKQEAVYKADIYTDKIVITLLYDEYNEEEKTVSEEEQEADGENDSPPATIIHLDNSSVEIVECGDIFVVYVKKVNVFVIPKSAFKAYECMEVKNRLSNIMGIRYKSDVRG